MSQCSSRERAICWSLFWIGLALLFNLGVYLTMGGEAALNFFTGYLIEKALSVDNLFVFLLIFNTFKVPRELFPKVLFWGILGALVMRGLFIFGGIALIGQFHQLIYLFGAFLIYAGVRLIWDKEKEIHPEKNLVLKLVKKIIPLTEGYEGDRFFVKRAGAYLATPLFLVVLLIESTDLLFALDSIPAILAITTDPFIVYTSNIFAILGLRALFLVLEEAMGLFHYLHYALAFILVFIGAKMLLQDLYPISTLVSLAVVAVALAVAVMASLIKGTKRT
jgi:tellurite resistance protein TerC